MEALSLFGEQTRRRRQTWFFVALGVVWMALLGHLIVGAHIAFFMALQPTSRSAAALPTDSGALLWGLVAAAVAVVLWASVAATLLRSASRVVPALLGARQAAGVDERTLAAVAEEMAVASGEPAGATRWYVLESSARNAFACGRSVSQGSILVTRGLLTALDRDELQAVVAHELAHLKNGDAHFAVQALAFAWVVIAVSTVACVGLLAAVAALALTTWLVGEVAEASNAEWGGCVALLGMAGVAVMGLVLLAAYALLVGVVLALVAIGVKAAASATSQSREYLADGCAAQWTRNPIALASALAKISGSAGVSGLRGALVAPLWFDQPRAIKGDGATQRLFSFLLHTHPPVERRLEFLTAMAGGAVVTDAPWMSSIHSARWQRMKEWALPLLATVLAAAVTFALVSDAMHAGSPMKPDRSSAAAPKSVCGKTNQPVVRARSAGAPGARVVARLPQGSSVTIVGERGDWHLVEWTTSSGVRRGWVARRLIDRGGQ